MTYGVDDSFLSYIHSYLLNRKHCVRINNINSDYVPQGSTVGPILCKCFFHDFCFIEIASGNNFADDNTLTAFRNNIQKLKHLLASESTVAIKWFKDNKLIVNPRQFPVTLSVKKKSV